MNIILCTQEHANILALNSSERAETVHIYTFKNVYDDDDFFFLALIWLLFQIYYVRDVILG